MSTPFDHTGFAIALAWPATYCKEPGSWYDPVTRWLGISRNNYYRAGHAAVVLIGNEEKKCHYFDFGRYHAPFQHGRVRGAITDHDLKMDTIPRVSADRNSIANMDEILGELQGNAACHGEGPLHASCTSIDFNAAYLKALTMQEAGPIAYGPFVQGGSNCSRFVHTVIKAGKPRWKQRLRLKYLIPFTPTPLSNVNALSHRRVLAVTREDVPFFPASPLSKKALTSTLPAPVRHKNIPEGARWLSGEGAGSWFSLKFNGGFLVVSRYSPEGMEECNGMYQASGRSDNNLYRSIVHNVNSDYDLDHPSNCKEVTINYQGVPLRFERTFNERKMRLEEFPIMSN